MSEDLKKLFLPLFKEALKAPRLSDFNNMGEWAVAMNEFKKKMDELEKQANDKISAEVLKNDEA